MKKYIQVQSYKRQMLNVYLDLIVNITAISKSAHLPKMLVQMKQGRKGEKFDRMLQIPQYPPLFLPPSQTCLQPMPSPNLSSLKKVISNESIMISKKHW